MPKKTTRRRTTASSSSPASSTTSSSRRRKAPSTPTTAHSDATEKTQGATITESSVWDSNPEYDICLLEAIEKFPPLGYHKSFAIINICATMKKILNHNVSIGEVEKRLDEFYDFTELNRDAIDVITMESFSELEEKQQEPPNFSFELPSEFFMNDQEQEA